MKTTIFVAAAYGLGAFASAQVIADRNTLDALLTTSTSENFENFDLGTHIALPLDVYSLDSTTITNGQGPGLVNPGVAYVDPSQTGLQWNGDGFYGLATKSIVSRGPTGQIMIVYASPIQAMGIDVKGFAGFGYNGTMGVYNGGTLLHTFFFDIAGDYGESTFLGYLNVNGITHVLLSDQDHVWSPIIDDHSFGAVPEPASMTILGLAAVAFLRGRRRVSYRK